MDIIKNLNRSMRKLARTQLDKIGMRDLVPDEDAPYLIDFVQEFISAKPEETPVRIYQPVPVPARPRLKERINSLCGDNQKVIERCTHWLEDRPGFIQTLSRANGIAHNAPQTFTEACTDPEAELHDMLLQEGIIAEKTDETTADMLATLQKISLATERPVYNLLALAWAQTKLETDTDTQTPEFYDAFNARLSPFGFEICFLSFSNHTSSIALRTLS